MSERQALRALASNLARGDVSFESHIARTLEMARLHPDVFVSINDDAIESARELDRKRGGVLPGFAGVPISLKDLFDVEGEVTLAGSMVMKKLASAAPRDADVVAPLREAGMLFVGRTNMSEFAFSGMGLNPHYPPLHSVWDRQTRRLPGGSSSGSAVSVALGIVPATLGSDTAGSCRIPAAFNGIVGVKPSYGRLSSRGVYPLSHSSDAPGPLGIDLDSCFVVDRLMSGVAADRVGAILKRGPDALRLLVPEGRVMEQLDDEVTRGFETAIERLAQAGASVVRQPLDGLDECVDMFLERPVVPYEAWQHHRQMIEAHGDLYDPYVRTRISAGAELSESDQQSRYKEKAGLVTRVESAVRHASVDAVLYPTVACVPPPVSSTLDADKIGAVNMRCLRNTATVNYFDGCAVTLPCHQDGEAPVGLMVCGLHGMDDEMYGVAGAVESVLAG